MLLRHGRIWRGGKKWSYAHRAWVDRQVFDEPALAEALALYRGGLAGQVRVNKSPSGCLWCRRLMASASSGAMDSTWSGSAGVAAGQAGSGDRASHGQPPEPGGSCHQQTVGAEAADPVAEVHGQVAGLLGGPCAVRVSGHPEDVHMPGAYLHDEQHSVESGLSPLSVFNPQRVDAHQMTASLEQGPRPRARTTGPR